jgi:hypothetical protein
MRSATDPPTYVSRFDSSARLSHPSDQLAATMLDHPLTDDFDQQQLIINRQLLNPFDGILNTDEVTALCMIVTP